VISGLQRAGGWFLKEDSMSLGLGVMIKMLCGCDEVDLSQLNNGIITNVSLDDDTLAIEFDSGKRLRIKDEGQSCCEHRYMTTDDDLPYYSGSKFMGAEIADGGSTSGEYDDEHEIQFLKITTSKGVFTVETHNEHNGYYGGFWVQASIDNGGA
jgi:hypothetical protein